MPSSKDHLVYNHPSSSKPSNWKSVSLTMANGSMQCDTGMEPRSGKMAVGFRDSGKTTKWTGMGPCIIMMEICIKGNGGMTRFMVTVSIHVQMDIFTRENGSMVKRKARDIKFGKMAKNTLASSKMGSSMAGVTWNTKTAVTTKVSSPVTKSTAEVILWVTLGKYVWINSR